MNNAEVIRNTSVIGTYLERGLFWMTQNYLFF
jgi:hypothetical protein